MNSKLWFFGKSMDSMKQRDHTRILWETQLQSHISFRLLCVYLYRRELKHVQPGECHDFFFLVSCVSRCFFISIVYGVGVWSYDTTDLYSLYFPVIGVPSVILPIFCIIVVYQFPTVTIYVYLLSVLSFHFFDSPPCLLIHFIYILWDCT